MFLSYAQRGQLFYDFVSLDCLLLLLFRTIGLQD